MAEYNCIYLQKGDDNKVMVMLEFRQNLLNDEFVKSFKPRKGLDIFTIVFISLNPENHGGLKPKELSALNLKSQNFTIKI